VSNMSIIEVKAFVPARDFSLSKRFYEDMGFDRSGRMVRYRRDQ
jgi:hypothetical protein